jgi:hypothetical protein
VISSRRSLWKNGKRWFVSSHLYVSVVVWRSG